MTLLGSAGLEVSGAGVRLTPTNAAFLARLAVAGDSWTSVDTLAQDIWPNEGYRARAQARTNVHHQIHQLRKILDPDRPGADSVILPKALNGAARYRLAIAREHIDIHIFSDLIERAHTADRAHAVELLTEALALWQGEPLIGLSQPFARSAAERLTALRRTARRELTGAYLAIGQTEHGLREGMRLLSDFPDEAETASAVRTLRQQWQDERDATLLTRQLAECDARVVVVIGDLFDQKDANLVVGFTDTFDTAVEQDLIINSASVQGQLLARRYDGNRTELDRWLGRGLSRVPPISTERQRDKPNGKRRRYPLGTVVPLLDQSPRVFAMAYGRMGCDLVVRSDLTTLETSLNNLWPAVYRYGQMAPAAVPLLGSGLARLTGTSPEHLLTLTLRTFVAHARLGPITPELRVVLRPEQVEKLDLREVGRTLSAL